MWMKDRGDDIEWESITKGSRTHEKDEQWQIKEWCNYEWELMNDCVFWLRVAWLWPSEWIIWVGQKIGGALVGDSLGPVQWDKSICDKGHPRIYILGSVSHILHRIPFWTKLSFCSKPILVYLQMSSPQDNASRTNTWAVYKECHGDRSICQFDARKFPYSRVNVLTLYPTVGQVIDVLGWHYHPKLINFLDCRTYIFWDKTGRGGIFRWEVLASGHVWWVVQWWCPLGIFNPSIGRDPGSGSYQGLGVIVVWAVGGRGEGRLKTSAKSAVTLVGGQQLNACHSSTAPDWFCWWMSGGTQAISHFVRCGWGFISMKW